MIFTGHPFLDHTPSLSGPESASKPSSVPEKIKARPIGALRGFTYAVSADYFVDGEKANRVPSCYHHPRSQPKMHPQRFAVVGGGAVDNLLSGVPKCRRQSRDCFQDNSIDPMNF
jgi:hypothetical protein